MSKANPKECLESFLTALLKPKALISEVSEYLTLTQLEDSKYVGGGTPAAHINGLYSIMKRSKSRKIKEKVSTNPLVTDCIIELKGINPKPTKIQCRLVKEIAPREAHADGQWGVNTSSFKILQL